MHAGKKLADAKRLGQVVVAAQLEPDDLVKLGVAGGKEQHRHVALGADAPAYLVAVDAGEHDVEDDQVVFLAECHLDGGVARIGDVHLVAFFGEVVAHEVRDRRLVVDYQNLLLVVLVHVCPFQGTGARRALLRFVVIVRIGAGAEGTL